MLEIVVKYFLTFIIISFLGWSIEEFYSIFIAKEKMNRGFLVGPLCPIYGFASIIMIGTLTPFKEHLIALFFAAIIICGLFEYISSWILEKTLKIKLWDYDDSNFKYSIKGRIALETLLPFGILGIVLVLLVNPFIQNILNSIDINILYGISIVVFIIGSIDLLFSIKVILEMPETSGDITLKKNKKVKQQFDDTTVIVRTQINNTTNTVKKQVQNTTKTVKKQIDNTTLNVKKQIKTTNDKVKSKIKKKSS